MMRLNFTVQINAPVEKVWNTMLDKDTYMQWVAFFMPGSSYQGDWEQGSKILFVAPDEKGNIGGMSSQIAENRLYEYISIHHLGIVQHGVEDTESEEAKKWNGFENYTFKRLGDNSTEVIIDVDVVEDFVEYMQETWPKALEKLKEIAEK